MSDIDICTDQGGQITALYVHTGEDIEAGQAVCKVKNFDGEVVVRSHQAGRISNIPHGVGFWINPDSTVAKVDLTIPKRVVLRFPHDTKFGPGGKPARPRLVPISTEPFRLPDRHRLPIHIGGGPPGTC